MCGGTGSDGKLRRGMCRKHYQRFMQHGDPTVVLVEMPEDRGVPGRANNRSQYMREWWAANKAKSPVYKQRWQRSDPVTARVSAWASEQRRRGLPPNVQAIAYARVLAGDPCSYCGGPAEQVDHITPQSAGGNGDWTNLTAACGDCNNRKHAKSLLHFMLDRVG